MEPHEEEAPGLRKDVIMPACAIFTPEGRDCRSAREAMILSDQQSVSDEKIIATPTSVRVLPEPVRRIIGDLSNMEKVLLGLDILPHGKTD